MLRFQIDPNYQPQWFLFAENTSGFTVTTGLNIARVLCEVKRVFEEIFGFDQVNSHAPLLVVHSPDGPVIFRENGIIFLSSEGAYYLQHIYQFAHELCHFMVEGEVCASYKWFEEALCRLMSKHVLRRICSRGETAPLCELGSLYSGIGDYIQRNCKGVDLQAEPFHSFFERHLPLLRQNCDMNELEYTIANQLDPLFSARPVLWQIVPKLNLIPSDAALSDAIHTVCVAAGIPDDLTALLLARFQV